MDQYVQQPGGANESNLFHPDEVVVSLNRQEVHNVQSPRQLPSSPTPQPVAPPASQTQVLPSPSIPSSVAPSDSFAWNASEFIEHEKSAVWFFGLILVAIAVGAITWFAAHDIFLSVMTVLGVGVFGVYATHRPKQASYRLSGAVLNINTRTYNLHDFHSFSVAPEGTLLRIELAPMKRFAVSLTVYCRPDDGDRIVGLLAAYLPLTPPSNDFSDRLMRSIRF
jgi:hypothetical protein